jgi:hypothetical protein
MRTTIFLACALAALVTTGAAQTPMKLAGKMECAAPNPYHVVPVADTAKHALSLSAAKCTWSEGAIGGQPLKNEDDAIASDATGNTSHDRGYGVGTTTLKDGAPVSSDCTWKFTGGTGKLDGIKGKGTCKGTFRPDGKVAFNIEGEYKLAAPAGQ